jgi:hypothetical protein
VRNPSKQVLLAQEQMYAQPEWWAACGDDISKSEDKLIAIKPREAVDQEHANLMPGGQWLM